MKPRLIIDTDIGTDVDDLWTLAMLPGLSDVQLDAITLVYGDTRARAQLAVTACDAMGLKAPIHRGCEKPLSDKEILWAGYEGTGVPDITETSYSATHADTDVGSRFSFPEPEGSVGLCECGPYLGEGPHARGAGLQRRKLYLLS